MPATKHYSIIADTRCDRLLLPIRAPGGILTPTVPPDMADTTNGR